MIWLGNTGTCGEFIASCSSIDPREVTTEPGIVDVKIVGRPASEHSLDQRFKAVTIDYVRIDDRACGIEGAY